MLTQKKFPDKNAFPPELQKFYLSPPKRLNDFYEEHNLTCLLVDTDEIDNTNGGIFSSYTGKRPDEIHYSIGIGLIEDKSTNYGATDISQKFIEFKRYFEAKYNDNRLCNVKYCVLKAYKLSEKIKKELTINEKDNRLMYAHNKTKPFQIGGAPVYFVKRDR